MGSQAKRCLETDCPAQACDASRSSWNVRADSQPCERVVEVDPFKDERYEKFVASLPDALIFHQPGWLKALQAESGTKPMVLACQDPDGRLTAVLPLSLTRGLPFRVGRHQIGRRLSSLPRTPAAGPLFTHERGAATLLQEAVRRADEQGLQLQIKSRVNSAVYEVDGLVPTTWRPTYILDLLASGDDFRLSDARNRHRIKSAVKQAEKHGLRVRPAENEDELRAWYRLFLQSMRRNVVPPRAMRFFVTLWKELRPAGSMELLLAEQHRGGRRRLVAGAMFLRFGKTVWYAFTGAEERDLPLHAGDLLLWHGIRQARAAGMHWFDFGEVAEEHPELVRFKTKWGAQPRDQYRYYSWQPDGREENGKLGMQAKRLCHAAWQRLPLPITSALGDLVYRRL